MGHQDDLTACWIVTRLTLDSSRRAPASAPDLIPDRWRPHQTGSEAAEVTLDRGGPETHAEIFLDPYSASTASSLPIWRRNCALDNAACSSRVLVRLAGRRSARALLLTPSMRRREALRAVAAEKIRSGSRWRAAPLHVEGRLGYRSCVPTL
jgi:hypothetical protein